MKIGPLSPVPTPPLSRSAADRKTDALHIAAGKLEADFLAEMLKSAGVGKSRETLGGGIGEDQFSSFLVTAQAGCMVKAGGIGLADQIFAALNAKGENGN